MPEGGPTGARIPRRSAVSHHGITFPTTNKGFTGFQPPMSTLPIEQLQSQLAALTDTKAFTAVVQEFSTVLAQDLGLQAKVAKAEADLVSATSFNEQLENDNVSENITLWQPAQVPPFPLPQHRGVKLIVIVALSIFAGLVAALVQHHIRPKRARRARPRQEEVSVPIILMPEDGKREPARRIPEVDISLPPEEGAPKR